MNQSLQRLSLNHITFCNTTINNDSGHVTTGFINKSLLSSLKVEACSHLSSLSSGTVWSRKAPPPPPWTVTSRAREWGFSGYAIEDGAFSPTKAEFSYILL